MEKQVSNEGIFGHFVDPCLAPSSRIQKLNPWKALKQISKGRKRKRDKGKEEADPEQQPPDKGLIGHQNGKLETSRMFGRQKGWGGAADVESALFEDGDEGELSRQTCLLLLAVTECLDSWT